jgi:Fe(3+) dicitrate transport protein
MPGAVVRLRLLSTGAEWKTATDRRGQFDFVAPPQGDYEIEGQAPGFAIAVQRFRYTGGALEVKLELAPAALRVQMLVVAERVVGTAEGLERVPGAAEYVDAGLLRGSRVFTTEEALRKVSGVNTRGEEGFGLRPNIAVRGLSPTRSMHILLLEDGLPLAYAPYGDNASYYHPPIDRFEGVEVVKGGGQIAYGPRTVGAVVNYLTPAPPERTSGSITLIGGNREYFNGHLRAGGTYFGTGMLFDYLRKQGDGSRENLHHALDDFNVKTLTTLNARNLLGVRFSRYAEDSQVTYSGLRQSEFEANPRANPFGNDSFRIQRYGTSLRHSWSPSASWVVTTAGYGTVFSRNWWRQSSNSSQRPNDAGDPLCGGMANLSTTCGNEGRLRDYYTYGVESKARTRFWTRSVGHEADFGARIHFENQDRLQKNGPLPTSRDGVIVESNLRTARAFSMFFQDGVRVGAWRFTPGVRVERIHYERTNRLGNGGAGVSGEEDVTAVVPGFGASYSPTAKFALFAGAHRGFAPPRVEDIISNHTGASVELDPELSWNYEAGVRAAPVDWMRVEATVFRLDFENQIVPASVAGGIGATLTNAGETLHQGLEFSAQLDWRRVFGSRHSFSWRTAYSWVPLARFEGERFSTVPGFTTVSVSGNRLPYAPRNLLTSSVTYSNAHGWNMLLEGVYTGRQFGDDLNTVMGTPDGQRGVIPGTAVFNAAMNYPVERLHTTVFIAAKNLFDRTYIVDRARGILPGIPRLVQAGLSWNFSLGYYVAHCDLTQRRIPCAA